MSGAEPVLPSRFPGRTGECRLHETTRTGTGFAATESVSGTHQTVNEGRKGTQEEDPAADVVHPVPLDTNVQVP